MVPTWECSCARGSFGNVGLTGEPGYAVGRCRLCDGGSVHVVLRWLVLAGLVLSPLRSATAQERPKSWYVLAGLAVVHQDGPTGESPQTYVTAPGGTSPGWLVAGGAFVWSRVSVEGELASTAIMRAQEPSRYGMTFNEERRDLFLGANVRFHARSNRRVDLEPLVGLGLVRHQGWSQTDYYRFWLLPQQQVVLGSRARYDTLTSVSLSAGVDLRLGGRHVAVVPSFRVRGATDSTDLASRYPGGFPRWTIAGGVSARIDF